jgi:hypothetical protein
MKTEQFIYSIVKFETQFAFEKTELKDVRKFLSNNLIMLKATNQEIPEYLQPDNIDDVAQEITNQINTAWNRNYNQG